MGVARLVVLVVVLVLGAPVRIGHAGVDWAKGLVTADGVGVADRHAPNPAVARGTSRRIAEDAAKRSIATQLPGLPIAGGGTVADKLTDPAIKARLDRAVAFALTLSAEPQTDGAWRVTMAVPIEAVRLAVGGPRVLPGAGDADPAVLIVDGVTSRPAITTAPTLWLDKLPPWAKDAPHVKADGIPTTGSTLILILH